MSRLCVFRQTGWFIAGLMAGLPASAAPTETSSVAGVAVAVATATPPDATATLQAMQSCRQETAALERLDCYDRILAPRQAGFGGAALVKARYQGEAWARATEQEKRRQGNTTELLVTQVPGERPTVVITTWLSAMFRHAGADVQLRGQYHPDAGGADAPSGCP